MKAIPRLQLLALVAVTGLALLLWGVPEGEGQTAQDTVVASDTIPAAQRPFSEPAADAAAPDGSKPD